MRGADDIKRKLWDARKSLSFRSSIVFDRNDETKQLSDFDFSVLPKAPHLNIKLHNTKVHVSVFVAKEKS